MTATRISTIREIGLTLSLALSMWTFATSLSFAYSARARQMCMGDAFRLCSAEIPNISRVVACMRRNKANLSPGCRSVMDQEDTAATKTKPVQARPVEQKPTVAPPVEQSAVADTKPVQTAPVEQKPTVAPPAEQSAAATALSQFRTCMRSCVASSVEQKPTTAPPIEESAIENTKPAQIEPVEQKPTTAPVEQPVGQAIPFRAAPREQKLTAAMPVQVKPIEARPASRATPANQRKLKHRKIAVARHARYGLRNVERTIGFALPIPVLIRFYW
jgi:hypothetical protein